MIDLNELKKKAYEYSKKRAKEWLLSHGSTTKIF